MRVVASGMVTAVGLSAAATAAAVRAGIARFEETPFQDVEGDPIVGARVRVVADGALGLVRYVELLTEALRECIESGACEPASVALLIAVPESERPGRPRDLESALLGSIQESLGVRFLARHSAIVPRGRAAGLVALARVPELLRDPDVQGCIVCGVDSLINALDLAHLDAVRRLKTASNSDGLIPGEGAAAVLVRRDAPDATGLEVVGIGSAREEHTVTSGRPNRAEGLRSAFQSALRAAKVPWSEIGFRITDLSGERYGFVEQATAVARTLRERKEVFPIWHPAECFAEIGAAFGPGLLAIAHHAFAKDYAPGPAALVCCGSDGGERVVAVVRAAEAGRG